MNHPNPEVYRLAAERIDDERNTFSCNAIESAARTMGYCHYFASLYKAQYVAMFGPHEFVSIRANSLGSLYCEGGTRSRINHPYWNQDAWQAGEKQRKEELKQCRINALLLMADIVENPA